MSYDNIISRSDLAPLIKEGGMKTQRGPSVSPGVTRGGSGTKASGKIGNPRPSFRNLGATPKK